MKIHILTRFSIPDPGQKYFADILDQKDEERLAFKFRAFETVTQPSVLNQEDGDFTWHIYAGRFLRDRLKAVDSRQEINFIDSIDEFKSIIIELAKGTKDAFMRLDDDDGLGPHVIGRVRQANPVGALSFPYGHQYRLVGTTIQKKPRCYPNVSAGLTTFGQHPHKYHHHRINLHVPTVYDDSIDSWLLCCSDHCYTKRLFQ